jgi:hypothetical protein
MKYKYPLDWIWQGHCLNCGQRLKPMECICIDGPKKPRPMRELRAEKKRIEESFQAGDE